MTAKEKMMIYSFEVEQQIRYIRELQEEYKKNPSEKLKQKIEEKLSELW